MPCIYGVLNLWCTTSLLCCIGESYLYCNISLMHCIFGALHLWCYGYALLVLCIVIFGGASLVRLLLCNASFSALFLGQGAIYFCCCVFGAMHCQLYRAGLLVLLAILRDIATATAVAHLLYVFAYLCICVYFILYLIYYDMFMHARYAAV